MAQTRRARRSTRRAGRGRRARFPLRRRLYRGIYNPMPTFTETADLGSVVMTYDPATLNGYASGIWQVAPNTIPQINSYANLYNQICIRRVKLIILPVYNVAQQNGPASAAAVQAVSVPRLTYAINDTSAATTPGTELAVLTDNGCKIRQMSRPTMISFRPVAQVSEGLTSGGFVAVNRRRLWITMNTGGLTTEHGGVSYFFTQDYAPNNPPISFNVYAKITFSLRDPK